MRVGVPDSPDGTFKARACTHQSGKASPPGVPAYRVRYAHSAPERRSLHCFTCRLNLLPNNGFELESVEKTIAIGRRLIDYRTEITVRAIRKRFEALRQAPQ